MRVLQANAVYWMKQYRYAVKADLSHRVGNNDIVFTIGTLMVLWQYHRTAIVKLDRVKNTLQLNTGGWTTPTTKERLNTTLHALIPDCRYWIVQHNYTWYITTGHPIDSWGRKGIENAINEGKLLPFYDGIYFSLMEDN